MSKNTIDKFEIGNLIRLRRQELGYTQEKLAEMLNVSPQQVQRYESARNRLNIENLQLLANALSVPVTYFFTNPGDQGCKKDEAELLCFYKKISDERTKNLVRKLACFAAEDFDHRKT